MKATRTGIVKGVGVKGAMFILGLRKCGLEAELGNPNLVRASCLGATTGWDNEQHPEETMLEKH